MNRALRKTSGFLTQTHEATQKSPRLLEAIAGAEWVLLRHPDQGMTVRGTVFRSWPIHPAEGVTFKIVYYFTDREVVLVGLYPAIPPSDS
jgi:hypothetical protein